MSVVLMGHRIVIQPNGKLAVYSTVVDDFILVNANNEDIIGLYLDRRKDQITQDVNEKIFQLLEGKKPYYQFTESFAELVEHIRRIHGEEAVQELKDDIKGT